MTEKQVYTETELIALLQQKQKSAFSYLYDNYSGALYSVVFSFVNESELANDILQEIFIKIWKQFGQYNPEKGKLFTWMVNITRNTCIDTLRSRLYQNSKQNQELTENVYKAAGTANIDIDRIGLRKLVYNLKEDYRILIELSYFQGFTQDEISQMLNIPLGTVKTRLRSALVQLREIVKK